MSGLYRGSEGYGRRNTYNLFHCDNYNYFNCCRIYRNT